jgi:hypothetical protein
MSAASSLAANSLAIVDLPTPLRPSIARTIGRLRLAITSSILDVIWSAGFTH